MTRSEVLANVNKLATCLETQTVTPWKCEGGACDRCLYHISTPEAAASVRALWNDATEKTRNTVRFDIRM